MMWEASKVYEIADGCRCMSCWEPTGQWEVDSKDIDAAPFLIGSKEEAEAIAAYLNELTGGMLIQQFLRSGHTLDELHCMYNIIHNRHSVYPNLVHLKYNQILSPFSEPIVRECRGLILDQSDNYNVICRPFDKFFNHNEPNCASIDWNTAYVLEKCDGSLCTIYYYDGHWNVSTTGTADACGSVGGNDMTFSKLFWDTFNSLGMKTDGLDIRTCFMFELMTSHNRVVVQHTKPRIVLIGARNLDTGAEVDYIGLQQCSRSINCELVRRFPLSDKDEILSTFDNINPCEQEGYVVVDAEFNRIKIKHPRYIVLHHMKDSCSRKYIIDIVRRNESAEVLSYFPEFRSAFDTATNEINNLRAYLICEYDKIKHIENRKEFALCAVKTKVPDALFSMKSRYVQSIDEYISTIRLDNLINILSLGWED